MQEEEIIDKDALDYICNGKSLADCFVENYKKDENIIYHDGKADYTGMKNYSLEAEDLSYRYSGATEDVNNYVCLDDVTSEGSCQSDEDLYRIIGLFKNNEEKYEAKLIKVNRSRTSYFGDTGAYSTGFNYYWNSTNGVMTDRSETINSNMWQYSNLNTENLNNIYYNYIISKYGRLKDLITFHKWTTGGIETFGTAKEVYNNELGENKIKEGMNKCYPKDNNTTVQACTLDDITFDGYIGLPYVSDYAYSAYPNGWDKNINVADSWNEEVAANEWMSTYYSWTITRAARNSKDARYAYGTGIIGTQSMVATHSMRAVFYLANSTILGWGWYY